MSIKQQAFNPIWCLEFFRVFHACERIKFINSLKVFLHLYWTLLLLSIFFVNAFIYNIFNSFELFKLLLNFIHIQVIINGSIIVNKLNRFLGQTFFVGKLGLNVIQC
jgi:hypothetical protein